MAAITTDFAGTETLAEAKTKLETVLEWWGFTPDIYGTWGDARYDLNKVLGAAGAAGIAANDAASAFIDALNLVNDPSAVFENQVSVSRSTIGTYITSDGYMSRAATNTARYDYTTGRRALLLESAATNLITDQPGSGTWTVNAVDPVALTYGQTEVDPGKSNGVRIDYTGSTSTAGIYHMDSAPAGAVTVSVYVKYISGEEVYAFGLAAGGTALRARFNINTGVVTGTNVGVTARVDILDSGWRRLIVTTTLPSAASVYTTFFVSSVGTGSRACLVCRAQLEAGSCATSYIDTMYAGTAVSRAADIAAPVDLSAYDLSGGFTLLVDARFDGVRGPYDRAAQVDDGTPANTSLVYWEASVDKLRALSIVKDVARADAALDHALKSDFKMVFASGPGYFRAAFNGALQPEDTSVAYWPPTVLRFGRSTAGNAPGRLLLYQVVLFPTVLSPARLEALTA